MIGPPAKHSTIGQRMPDPKNRTKWHEEDNNKTGESFTKFVQARVESMSAWRQKGSNASKCDCAVASPSAICIEPDRFDFTRVRSLFFFFLLLENYDTKTCFAGKRSIYRRATLIADFRFPVRAFKFNRLGAAH